MAVKRGFKTWCEKIAEYYRKQLKIEPTEPLCAWKLAEHLGVLVWTPEAIPDVSKMVLDQLLSKDSSSWSAVTINHLGQNLIILNSSHAPQRQSNDLMHELSHLICGHNPTRVDVSEDGLLMISDYSQDLEEEANILAATLLLPRVALEKIKKQGISLEAAIKKYNVSRHLYTWRTNVTGINKQFQRRQQLG